MDGKCVCVAEPTRLMLPIFDWEAHLPGPAVSGQGLKDLLRIVVPFLGAPVLVQQSAWEEMYRLAVLLVV